MESELLKITEGDETILEMVTVDDNPGGCYSCARFMKMAVAIRYESKERRICLKCFAGKIVQGLLVPGHTHPVP